MSDMLSEGAGDWLVEGCGGAWMGVALDWLGDWTRGSPLSGGLGLGVGHGVQSSAVRRRRFLGVVPGVTRRSSGMLHLVVKKHINAPFSGKKIHYCSI